MTRDQDAKDFISDLRKADYKSLREFPILRHNTKFAIRSINEVIDWYGLEEMTVDESEVRIIKNNDWQKICRDFPYQGVFDPSSRMCFIKFNPSGNPNKENVVTSYQISHELSHKAMKNNGLETYSPHLNEGFADEIAKRVMQKLWPIQEGIVLCGDYLRSTSDVVYMDESIIVLYGRYPQMYLLDAINRNNGELYQKLRFCALYNKPEIAKETVESTYGKEISDEIAKPLPDISGLINEIDNFGKLNLY